MSSESWREAIDFGQLTPVQAARIEYLFKIPDDEPIFTLRGRDLLAPAAVEAWVLGAEAEQGTVPQEKIEDARRIAAVMETVPNRRLPD